MRPGVGQEASTPDVMWSEPQVSGFSTRVVLSTKAVDDRRSFGLGSVSTSCDENAWSFPLQWPFVDDAAVELSDFAVLFWIRWDGLEPIGIDKGIRRSDGAATPATLPPVDQSSSVYLSALAATKSFPSLLASVA